MHHVPEQHEEEVTADIPLVDLVHDHVTHSSETSLQAPAITGVGEVVETSERPSLYRGDKRDERDDRDEGIEGDKRDKRDEGIEGDKRDKRDERYKGFEGDKIKICTPVFETVCKVIEFFTLYGKIILFWLLCV